MYKWVVVYFLTLSVTQAQTIYPYRVCQSPTVLKEFSGIAQLESNTLVAINDGGNPTELYFLDTLGKLRQTIQLPTAKNTDWEELFVHNETVYIADVGDNLCHRKQVNWYTYNTKTKQLTASKNFTFSGKKNAQSKENRLYDCEAGFVFNNHVYFFSKSHANPYKGKSYQYKIPLTNQAFVIPKNDSTNFGNKGFLSNSITGAAITANKKIAAFLSCSRIWFAVNFPDDNFFKGYHMDFSFEGLTQKEAITFLNGYKFVVADERTASVLGGRLYFFDLLPYLNGTTRYQKPVVQLAFVKKVAANQLSGQFTVKNNAKKIQVCVVDAKGNVLEKINLVKNTNKAVLNIKPKNIHQCKAYWVVSNDTILFTGRIK